MPVSCLPIAWKTQVARSNLKNNSFPENWMWKRAQWRELEAIVCFVAKNSFDADKVR